MLSAECKGSKGAKSISSRDSNFGEEAKKLNVEQRKKWQSSESMSSSSESSSEGGYKKKDKKSKQ